MQKFPHFIFGFAKNCKKILCIFEFNYAHCSILYYCFFIAISGAAKGQQAPENDKNADSLYTLFVYYNNIDHYDSAMYYGDQFVKDRLKYGTTSQKIEAYNHKIKSLLNFNKLNEAFKLTLSAYQKYCEINNEQAECQKCYLLNMHLTEFMITLKDYRQGINYINKSCNPELNERNFYVKARLYVLMEKKDSALMQTLQSITIARAQNNRAKLVATYNQHGLINMSLGQYNEAIGAFSEAIKLVDSLDLNENRYGFLIGNLGACYNEIKDYDKAYKFLLIDSDKSKEVDDQSYYSAQLMLAEIDIKRKEYKQALLRLDLLQAKDQALKEYNPNLTKPQQLHTFEMYMEVFQVLGKKTKYQYHLKRWVTLIKDDSQSRIETNQILLEEYAKNTLKQATLQVETEKEVLNQKLIIKEQEEHQSKLQKWLLAGAAMFIILIILFFLSRFRKRAFLKETQLKIANKEQEFLKLKVEEENKNVQALSHELIAKQDFSAKLIAQLAGFDSLSKNDLRAIELYIQNELDIKSTRVHLQKQMGEVSGNFYNELKIKHPNLTELELKLAGMVVMKMSNKEIAISKNTALESSKKLRIDLRKS